MKQVQGTASEHVDAPLDECFALLVAVEEYRAWHPELIQEIKVLERDADGHAACARARLHISAGPVDKKLELTVAIDAEPPDRVTLTRLPEDPDDEEGFQATWTLHRDGGTRIDIELDALIDIPGIVPLGSAGDLVARELVEDARKALGER